MIFMGLYSFDSDVGFMHADAERLAKDLKFGDGIHFPGDDRLELGMETAQAGRSMWYPELGRRVHRGDIVARRYAVYRHNEDGTFTRIGHWRLEEFDRILLDIAGLRVEAANHQQTSDIIDAANAADEKASTEQFIGVGADMLEHRLRIWNDTTQGKNRFRGMPGMRDKPKAIITKPKKAGDQVDAVSVGW